MTTFFFDMSGEGLGIRDWSIGSGQFAYAYTRHKLEIAGKPIQHSHDFRIYDLPVNQDGKLLMFAGYSYLDGGCVLEDADGYAFALIHKQDNVFGGYNKLALQYGRGIGFNAGAGVSIGSDVAKLLTDVQAASNLEKVETWRIVNQSVFEADQWAMMSAFVYEEKNFSRFDNTDQSWLSLGLRPMWYVNNNLRLVAELGYDRVDDKFTGIEGKLTKLSMAVEFASKKGFWELPVFRLFATYGWWSDEWRGQVGGVAYTDRTEGWNVGLQIEHWR